MPAAYLTRTHHHRPAGDVVRTQRGGLLISRPESFGGTMPRSWTVAVKTKKDNLRWAYNGLRFATQGEACAWIAQLEHRWRDLVEHKVEATTDAPNTAFPVPSDRYNVRRT